MDLWRRREASGDLWRLTTSGVDSSGAGKTGVKSDLTLAVGLGVTGGCRLVGVVVLFCGSVDIASEK